ncbi:MAG: calcium-binding protein, partial [Waterburya sp.]
MSTNYNNEPKKTYEAPKYEAAKEYEYEEYQPSQEYYEPPAQKDVYVDSYWTPTYEYIQDKYSEEKYAEKQYMPEKSEEGYGTEKVDYLIANEYNNVMETYANNDVIKAGYGNDKINAGEGDDCLWGINKEHNAEDQKYAQEDYKETDWLTGGGGKDIYA